MNVILKQDFQQNQLMQDEWLCYDLYLTSDLEMYLIDEKNSIIVEQCSSEAMSKALRRVLSLNRKQIDEIKKNANNTAKSCFDYHTWILDIKNFIEG